MSDEHPTLISVIIPVLNESENLTEAYRRVRETFEPLASRYAFEIVFTDNHSTDATFQHIAAQQRRH